MMTRHEAKMIAEELAKVLKPKPEEDFLTQEQLAKLLGISVSYVRHHQTDFPHIKIGCHTRYIKSKVIESLMR